MLSPRFEGLPKKSRSIPKKARRVHGVYLGKTSVKRKQPVVICGDLLVADADCVSPKRFCSGASLIRPRRLL
ncbi:unnamed protein product [Prunus armeniaca]|uniref:Uncharacterized protein n=1 Tax=Prunus armeniaca TaxID=36596 RepID=A0A6J5VQU7_PRUAR|nr:unnamed protein product [Prunus armeniaca]